MTRMRVLGISLAAALLVAALPQAHAQGNLKIAYVNMTYLISNAPDTQAVNKQLNDEFAPRQAELESMQKELQDKADTYQRNADVMTQDERTKLQRELQDRDRALQRRQNELQDDFTYRQNEVVNDLQQTVSKKVQTYVESKGYDLVVTNVVFASKAVDITEEVLKAISGDAAKSK